MRFSICPCCEIPSGGIYDFYTIPTPLARLYGSYVWVNDDYGYAFVYGNKLHDVYSLEFVALGRLVLSPSYNSVPYFNSTAFSTLITNYSSLYDIDGWNINNITGDLSLDIQYSESPGTYNHRHGFPTFIRGNNENVWRLSTFGVNQWPGYNPLSGHNLDSSGWTTIGSGARIEDNRLVLTTTGFTTNCYIEYENPNPDTMFLEMIRFSLHNDYTGSVIVDISGEYGVLSYGPSYYASGYRTWLYGIGSPNGMGRYTSPYNLLEQDSPYPAITYTAISGSGTTLFSIFPSIDTYYNDVRNYKVRISLGDGTTGYYGTYSTGITGINNDSGYYCQIDDIYISYVDTGVLDGQYTTNEINLEMFYAIELFDIENKKVEQQYLMNETIPFFGSPVYYTTGNTILLNDYISDTDFANIVRFTGTVYDNYSILNPVSMYEPYMIGAHSTKAASEYFYTNTHLDSHCPTKFIASISSDASKYALHKYRIESYDANNLIDIPLLGLGTWTNFTGYGIGYSDVGHVWDYLVDFDNSGNINFKYGVSVDFTDLERVNIPINDKLRLLFDEYNTTYDIGASNTTFYCPRIHIVSPRDYPNCFSVKYPKLVYSGGVATSSSYSWTETTEILYGPIYTGSVDVDFIVRYGSGVGSPPAFNPNDYNLDGFTLNPFSFVNTNGDTITGEYITVNIPYICGDPNSEVFWSGSSTENRIPIDYDTRFTLATPYSGFWSLGYSPQVRSFVLYGDYKENNTGAIFVYQECHNADLSPSLQTLDSYIKLKINDNIIWDKRVSGTSGYDDLMDQNQWGDIYPIRGLTAIKNSDSVISNSSQIDFVWFEKLYINTGLPLDIDGPYTGWRMHATNGNGVDVWTLDTISGYGYHTVPTVTANSDRFLYVNDFCIGHPDVVWQDFITWYQHPSGKNIDAPNSGDWPITGDMYTVHFSGTSGLLSSFGISHDKAYIIPCSNKTNIIDLSPSYATGGYTGSFGQDIPLYTYDSVPLQFNICTFYNSNWINYAGGDNNGYMKLSRPHNQDGSYWFYVGSPAEQCLDFTNQECIGDSNISYNAPLPSEWFAFQEDYALTIFTGQIVASGIYGSGLI